LSARLGALASSQPPSHKGQRPSYKTDTKWFAKLAGKVGKVRYDSGAEVDADVALRRHVVTQVAQAGGRLTMEAMRA
jgi:hypothetical protein